MARKIYCRDGRWYGDFRAFGLGRIALKRPEEARATTTKAEAIRLYDQILATALGDIVSVPEEEPHAEHKATTLEGALLSYTAFYGSVVDPGVTRDRHRYTQIICQYLPGSLPLRRLTTMGVNALVVKLRDAKGLNGQPLSSGYRKKILTFLKAALGQAVANGYLRTNPVQVPRILAPAVRYRPTRYFSVEEAGQILTALQRNPDGTRPADWPRGTPDYLFEQVLFALCTGARRLEIQAQRWEWVDWENDRLRIYTSKQRGEDRRRVGEDILRRVPLWPQLKQALRLYYLRAGRPESGLMFPKHRESPLRKTAGQGLELGGFVDKALVRVLTMRGLIQDGMFLGRPGHQFGFREFRVTYCATRLQTVEPVPGYPGAFTSIALKTVSTEMGHKSTAMVEEIYGKIQEQQVRIPEVRYPLNGESIDQIGESIRQRLVIGNQMA